MKRHPIEGGGGLPLALKIHTVTTGNHTKCFRVIDLGVMTPCEKILQTAVDERAGN